MKSIVLLLMMSSSAFAQVHGGDVELTVVNGEITTNERVYEAELGEILPNEVDEPGFDSEPGTFPTGSSVGFSILDSLRKWDGSDFDTIPAETMSMRFGSSLGPIVTPASPLIVDGFDLNVSADGAWHRHYDFVLGGPASTGVYLLQLRLDSSDAGLSSSDPFYIVFNQNDTVMNHDEAITYVTSNIVAKPSIDGDYNGDGQTDLADYSAWQSTFGAGVSMGDGADGNLDGHIDAADYTVWRDAFEAEATSVPEAGTLSLLFVALLALPTRRVTW